MNYFAHGRLFVDEPYMLVGTAIPDLMNVVDRKVRVRSRNAEPFLEDADPRVAAIARGVAQHHADDAWFHQTDAFARLSWEFTVMARDAAPDDSLRPSFLGHILVEILLDSTLIAEDPPLLERYYSAIEAVDPSLVQQAVSRMAPRPADRLAEFLPLFANERFLHDYGDDAKLMRRLNQVMRRVGLPQLEENFARIFPAARAQVADAKGDLLNACPC